MNEIEIEKMEEELTKWVVDSKCNEKTGYQKCKKCDADVVNLRTNQNAYETIRIYQAHEAEYHKKKLNNMNNTEIENKEVVPNQEQTEPQVKNREIKLHTMVGVVNTKHKQKSRSGKYAGSYYYDLSVSIETKGYEKIEKLTAYKPYLTEQIWKDIEEDNWVRKEYIFKCNKDNHWQLKSWKEV